ncbi:MAG: methyltransferase domain-containing protein [Acidimicrobiaceae bacterium]|nr:methyltransferase domain-containing protein [Acidimicrobiaceae bacterium]
MPTDNAASWDRYAAVYQAGAQLPTTFAHYGPDIPTEADLRLLGDLRGKRVLELGCGGAQCSIAFAKQGAIATGVDFSAEQLAFARRLCEREGVRVDLRQGDIAELAFLRADSVDLVFSAYTFGYIEDLNRVFRQVHRVLKVGAPLVFSLSHPAYDMLDDEADPPLLVRRSYFDGAPMDETLAGIRFRQYHHTISDLYMSLIRASYRVDIILEPEPSRGAPRSQFWRETFSMVPRTLVIRARKEGH